MTAFFEAFSAFLATGTIWVYLVIFFGKIVEVWPGFGCTYSWRHHP